MSCRGAFMKQWCAMLILSAIVFTVNECFLSDVFFLTIICAFMDAMMLLLFAKRIKACTHAAMWGYKPRTRSRVLTQCAMLMLFAFIYVLKLTLFESRKAGVPAGAVDAEPRPEQALLLTGLGMPLCGWQLSCSRLLRTTQL